MSVYYCTNQLNLNAMLKAKFIEEITVIDPDTKGNVQLEIYKHPGGGIFAIDGSYLETFDENEPIIIPDPFDNEFSELMLEA
jgi:hypothetical protein